MVVSLANISAAKRARSYVCMTLEIQFQILVPVGKRTAWPECSEAARSRRFLRARALKSETFEETAVLYRNKQRLASNFT